MYKAIDDLMKEHRLIERVLGALETFAGEAGQKDDEAVRRTAADFASFFQNFADRCHHGKEEDRLFAAMVAKGFPREFGPIAVMLAEHTEGREHVGALAAIGSGRGPLTQEESESLLHHAGAYVPLLRAHIMKEDNILYPMAEQSLPPEVMADLAGQFDAFERDVMGEGAHDSFHALAQKLTAAYPPAEQPAAASGACFSCPGHM